MTDIVERLRGWAECGPNDLLEAASADLFVAADEIERLRWTLEFILGVDRIDDAHVAARAALGKDK